MATDYSDFLLVCEDGNIWWRKADAIKLGAGYLPISDDKHNLIPVLRALTNQVIVNQRTLIGALGRAHPEVAHPQFVKRDDGFYIEADKFLQWLTQYLSVTQAKEIQFPNELAHGVRAAVGARPERQRQNRAEGTSPEAKTRPEDYFDFPGAFKVLDTRLKATPEEMAAWVFRGTKADMLNSLNEREKCEQTSLESDLKERERIARMGSKDDGLAAYLNVNELDPPLRFHYSYAGRGDFDYLEPLMACSFLKDDIDRFEPDERWITGEILIERWRSHVPRPEAFIRGKITESRLYDLHPISGLTQGTHPEDPALPPMTSALFALSLVEKIEAKFGKNGLHDKNKKKAGRKSRRTPEFEQTVMQAAKALDARSGGTLRSPRAISEHVEFVSHVQKAGFNWFGENRHERINSKPDEKAYTKEYGIEQRYIKHLILQSREKT